MSPSLHLTHAHAQATPRRAAAAAAAAAVVTRSHAASCCVRVAACAGVRTALRDTFGHVSARRIATLGSFDVVRRRAARQPQVAHGGVTEPLIGWPLTHTYTPHAAAAAQTHAGQRRRR